MVAGPAGDPEDLCHRVRLLQSDRADQLGRYELRGLRPGEYRVLGFEEIESGAYWQPGFLEALGEAGETVEVASGSRQVRKLKLTEAPAQ